ncbi:unnamed protein product, partial [Ectocarpus sp. 12 AP-2014]
VRCSRCSPVEQLPSWNSIGLLGIKRQGVVDGLWSRPMVEYGAPSWAKQGWPAECAPHPHPAAYVCVFVPLFWRQFTHSLVHMFDASVGDTGGTLHRSMLRRFFCFLCGINFFTLTDREICHIYLFSPDEAKSSSGSSHPQTPVSPESALPLSSDCCYL